MIIIHAHLQIKPDQEQAFLAAAKELIAATRQEEGNISYDLAKSTEREQQYTMIDCGKMKLLQLPTTQARISKLLFNKQQHSWPLQ